MGIRLDLAVGIHYTLPVLSRANPPASASDRARVAFLQLAIALCLAASVSCGAGTATSGAKHSNWPPLAVTWVERTKARLSELDFEGAQLALDNASRLLPGEPEVKLLEARMALAQMRYEDAISGLQGLDSADAQGLRARALWYSGRVAAAADELRILLARPEPEDAWAKGVFDLASSGVGREPFRVTGERLAVVDMPNLPQPALVVPVELNAEPVLALVATGSPEVVVDSAQGQATWVSLRFARRIEVKDVPALGRDLSALSQQMGAPIRMLLGVNLLRRLNATFDFRARQFVVRTYAPPPPPVGTAVPISYIKGGGMVIRSLLGVGEAARAAALLVDTGMTFPVALSEAGWAKSGADLQGLRPVGGGGPLKQGTIPQMTLGGFVLPGIPALAGMPIEQLNQGSAISVEGVVGAGLLAEFRVSLVNEGRVMWLEQLGSPESSPTEGP